jgi:uncharacterized protein YndB with AHSA1/START domain
MAENNNNNSPNTHGLNVERKSDTEFCATQIINASAQHVFEAWSNPNLFKLWWVPKSAGMSLLSCDMDVRTGGTYRLVFQHPAFDQPMAFFGTYEKVLPLKCITWTNDESEQGAVSSATFEEVDGKTIVSYSEVYSTSEALEEALAGSAEALPEQFRQLEELLAGM